MIRLNGSWARTLRAEPVLERAVVEEAGQVVGLGADLDRPMDLRVLERDRDLRGEELDELELLLAVARARGRAARGSGRRSRRRGRAAGRRSGCRRRGPVAELVDPRVAALVERRAPARCGRRPRSRGPPRRAATAPCTRSAWMPLAVSGRRRPVVAVEDLDREVVVADEVRQALGDLVEDRARLEGRQDRLGDLEQRPLVGELPAEGVGLGAEEARSRRRWRTPGRRSWRRSRAAAGRRR